MSVAPLSAFIAGLPKVELHVHHVGSASPAIVSELAMRHPGVVPVDPDELRRFFEFRDFAHFVEVYLAVVDLIRAETLVYVSDDAFERTALVRVVDSKPAYIRSWAHGKWGNDLLALPRFDG